MAALHEALRRELAKRVIDAREVSEQGAIAALGRLAVTEREPHSHLTPDERVLRNRLRARARALGDRLRPNGTQEVERLTEEVAYEAWHRMLFARFLAENGLLVHPDHGVSVTLAECEELAAEEGAEDRWMLASRYAARMLPQIFRPDDPALQVSFAPEHRVALERLLEELAPEVFRADDSLGWVYQFWQAKKKDEVNAAGEPITGDTLPAVTQLFTEPYMVSFLLENTIGAWWAGRHPGKEPPVPMPYLRRLEDGTPAAGTFEGWPKTWREFSLLDPCCGSGHFLVAALRLLVPLRMHDEELDTESAVDAVLRENLYGLELDARCTQIAAFAVALAAWTTPGATEYRHLPELQIACSGLSVGGKREEWLALAEGDQRLASALGRLHDLFRLAPELGSLIDPSEGRADLLTAGFADVAPLLERALASERVRRDEQREANAVTAHGVMKATALLVKRYSLIATNVPYLVRGKQGRLLRDFCAAHYSSARQDLASVFVVRALELCAQGGATALVTPQSWLFQDSYADLRRDLLVSRRWEFVARLGPGAFSTITGEVVNVVLTMLSASAHGPSHRLHGIDVADEVGAAAKASCLRAGPVVSVTQSSQLATPNARVLLREIAATETLSAIADAFPGLQTGDLPRLSRLFWEISGIADPWVHFQGTVKQTTPFGGREALLYAPEGDGAPYVIDGTVIRGREAWGREGVAVTQMSNLPVTLYTGEIYDNNNAVIVPRSRQHLPVLWAFCSSSTFAREVRTIDRALAVKSQALVQIPFDLAHWSSKASTQFPDGLPEPHSMDPTQWIFRGQITDTHYPFQVAAAILLGYRWPEQPMSRELDALSDSDGIVCLPAVRGERSAADRLQAVLSVAYGTDWSPALREELLANVGYRGKSIEQWLRDAFFDQHCKLFHQRPFIWHVWDGLKDGFSALVNYHKLTHAALEALTYTYLGDWLARQEEARKRDDRGADVRVAKAKELQEKLKLILAGEPPYDIFVRWKAPQEQPIGWDPDLNDGVRVNIWPFVQAGVLRAKVSVNWKKDRGKNPAGTAWGPDRHNRYEDIPRADRPDALRDVEHLTTEVKRSLRSGASASPERRNPPPHEGAQARSPAKRADR
jgi:hypothetical protein